MWDDRSKVCRHSGRVAAMDTMIVRITAKRGCEDDHSEECLWDDHSEEAYYTRHEDETII